MEHEEKFEEIFAPKKQAKKKQNNNEQQSTIDIMADKSTSADARVNKVVQSGKWNLLSYECEKAELDVRQSIFAFFSSF